MHSILEGRKGKRDDSWDVIDESPNTVKSAPTQDDTEATTRAYEQARAALDHIAGGGGPPAEEPDDGEDASVEAAYRDARQAIDAISEGLPARGFRMPPRRPRTFHGVPVHVLCKGIRTVALIVVMLTCLMLFLTTVARVEELESAIVSLQAQVAYNDRLGELYADSIKEELEEEIEGASIYIEKILDIESDMDILYSLLYSLEERVDNAGEAAAVPVPAPAVIRPWPEALELSKLRQQIKKLKSELSDTRGLLWRLEERSHERKRQLSELSAGVEESKLRTGDLVAKMWYFEGVASDLKANFTSVEQTQRAVGELHNRIDQEHQDLELRLGAQEWHRATEQDRAAARLQGVERRLDAAVDGIESHLVELTQKVHAGLAKGQAQNAAVIEDLSDLVLEVRALKQNIRNDAPKENARRRLKFLQPPVPEPSSFPTFAPAMADDTELCWDEPTCPDYFDRTTWIGDAKASKPNASPAVPEPVCESPPLSFEFDYSRLYWKHAVQERRQQPPLTDDCDLKSKWLATIPSSRRSYNKTSNTSFLSSPWPLQSLWKPLVTLFDLPSSSEPGFCLFGDANELLESDLQTCGCANNAFLFHNSTYPLDSKMCKSGRWTFGPSVSNIAPNF